MFDYDFNGEMKHTLLIGQLSYHYYKINIMYEDFEGSDVKLIVLSNIRDFFDTEERIQKIKNILKKQLLEHFEKEYMDVKWKIPKYIQSIIIKKFEVL
jgi:hypothetical protein